VNSNLVSKEKVLSPTLDSADMYASLLSVHFQIPDSTFFLPRASQSASCVALSKVPDEGAYSYYFVLHGVLYSTREFTHCSFCRFPDYVSVLLSA